METEKHFFEINLSMPVDSERTALMEGEFFKAVSTLQKEQIQWNVVRQHSHGIAMLGTERIETDAIREMLEDILPGIVVCVKNEDDYPDD